MEHNDLDVSSRKSAHRPAFTLPDKVLLNVSGSRYELMWSLIEMRHLTRLEKLHKCLIENESWEGVCDGYDEEKNEFFFQRDAVVFNSVLCFYRTGRIHIPKDVCVEHFQRECEYWGIGLKDLAECCHHYYQQEMEVIDNMKKINSVFRRNFALVNLEMDQGRWLRLRKRVWDLFENPKSSRAAKVSYKFHLIKSSLKFIIGRLLYDNSTYFKLNTVCNSIDLYGQLRYFRGGFSFASDGQIDLIRCVTMFSHFRPRVIP